MTKRPDLDEYDNEVIQYEKTAIGISTFNGEPMFDIVELELDSIQKAYKNSEALIAVREMQS